MDRLTNFRFHVNAVTGGFAVMATWEEGERPMNSQPKTVPTLDEVIDLMKTFFEYKQAKQLKAKLPISDTALRRKMAMFQ